MELNKNGINKEIKAKVLTDEEMREIGFTDYRIGNWYFNKMISKEYDISFNLTINKDNPGDIGIDVLDESFGQPYDYQSMLESDPTDSVCLIVKEKVEELMKYLKEKNVLDGHIYGEYI